jgi:CHASE2 domain-containing sensor protein
MPEKAIVNVLPDWVIWLVLSVWGGTAAYLHQIDLDRRRFRWGEYGAKLVIAGFAGQVLLFTAQAAGVAAPWMGVVSGMAGFMGADAINLLKVAFVRRFKAAAAEPAESAEKKSAGAGR